jgi:hypothetical protein
MTSASRFHGQQELLLARTNVYCPQVCLNECGGILECLKHRDLTLCTMSKRRMFGPLNIRGSIELRIVRLDNNKYSFS